MPKYQYYERPDGDGLNQFISPTWETAFLFVRSVSIFLFGGVLIFGQKTEARETQSA